VNISIALGTPVERLPCSLLWSRVLGNVRSGVALGGFGERLDFSNIRDMTLSIWAANSCPKSRPGSSSISGSLDNN
jgi:hypothetical protein